MNGVDTNGVDPRQWLEANQRYLGQHVRRVGALLHHHLARNDGAQGSDAPGTANDAEILAELDQARAAMPATGMIDTLCETFGLSAFERDLLLLCAAVELDASIGADCARANGDPRRRAPSFGMALAMLPQPHWSALTPSAPLRYWRLLELAPSDNLTGAALRIDEWSLHALVGLAELDPRLRTSALLVSDTASAANHRELAAQISRHWAGADLRTLPPVELCGSHAADKRAVAGAVGKALGVAVYRIDAAELPVQAGERESFLRLWEREMALGRALLLIECDDNDSVQTQRQLQALMRQARGAYLLSVFDPLALGREHLRLDVALPNAAEQRVLWQQALGQHAQRLNGTLDRVSGHFRLGADAIVNARAELGHDDEWLDDEELGQRIWTACRNQARPRLRELAQQVSCRACWDDLVLPALQKQALREIVAHVRRQNTVYEHWGFAAKSLRGLGITALFSGPSGTGKTMAAEVLATELALDLFRIDLSSVVSKYIGETEKQLRRIFDAAEAGGAVLLFDEADALFGKRSEVKDSHDRYANIEVSYLLQRMEAYRGLAVLTTNLKGALDKAFLRRIRFVIPFAFPDAGQRAEIWRRVFPEQTPTDALDVDKLARLNVAGGNIHNIALNAAFLAADQGRRVGMRDLQVAAQTECLKLERSVQAEVRDWV